MRQSSEFKLWQISVTWRRKHAGDGGPGIGSLLKQSEEPVDNRLETGNCSRDDPEYHHHQAYKGEVAGPIRFRVMNQSHDFLP